MLVSRLIDVYYWPGLLSIALGVMSLMRLRRCSRLQAPEWLLSTGVVGALAIAGGIAWLVVEHHRVLRIESHWLAEHSGRAAVLLRSATNPRCKASMSRLRSSGTTALVRLDGMPAVIRPRLRATNRPARRRGPGRSGR